MRLGGIDALKTAVAISRQLECVVQHRTEALETDAPLASSRRKKRELPGSLPKFMRKYVAAIPLLLASSLRSANSLCAQEMAVTLDSARTLCALRRTLLTARSS